VRDVAGALIVGLAVVVFVALHVPMLRAVAEHLATR
jgi:hypothetical protein